jgi:hypothetical protein
MQKNCYKNLNPKKQCTFKYFKIDLIFKSSIFNGFIILKMHVKELSSGDCNHIIFIISLTFNPHLNNDIL